jgi:hypothetical protein
MKYIVVYGSAKAAPSAVTAALVLVKGPVIVGVFTPQDEVPLGWRIVETTLRPVLVP